MSDNGNWPKNLAAPPWSVAVTGAYAAPFPDEPAAPVIPPASEWPLVPTPVDTELQTKFVALRAAVKMAVRHYDQVGTDSIEGVMEGLKDALEEAG